MTSITNKHLKVTMRFQLFHKQRARVAVDLLATGCDRKKTKVRDAMQRELHFQCERKDSLVEKRSLEATQTHEANREGSREVRGI